MEQVGRGEVRTRVRDEEEHRGVQRLGSKKLPVSLELLSFQMVTLLSPLVSEKDFR